MWVCECAVVGTRECVREIARICVPACISVRVSLYNLITIITKTYLDWFEENKFCIFVCQVQR